MDMTTALFLGRLYVLESPDAIDGRKTIPHQIYTLGGTRLAPYMPSECRRPS